MVSVVIPAYNSASYIEGCLDSVFKQTFKDWEVIIIDDGSNDDTRIVIEEYINRSNILSGRFQYLRNEKNMGAAAARNPGIEVSRGDFISFLDSDDIWRPQKLERVMDIFDRFSEVDLVCHNEYMTKDCKIIRKLEYDKNVKNLNLSDKDLVYRKLFLGNFLSTSAVTIRKACLKNMLFDETFSVAEDYDLWLRLARTCRFYFLPDFLGEFRIINNNSLSGDFNKVFKGYIEVANKNKADAGKIIFYIRMLRCYLFLFKNKLKDIIPRNKGVVPL